MPAPKLRADITGNTVKNIIEPGNKIMAKTLKNVFQSLAGLAGVLIASSAMAAGAADIAVGGTILTGSCTPKLSNDMIDLEVTKVSELTDPSNQLSVKNTTLTIDCAVPLVVGWSIMDNKHATVAQPLRITNSMHPGVTTSDPDYMSGLGATAEGVNIGGYEIQIDDGATVDGKAASVYINESGYPGSVGRFKEFTPGWGLLRADGVTAFSIGESGSPVPTAFTQAVFPLFINSAVVSGVVLDLADDTVMEGSTTINLVYL
ncbi:TPA: DUF1120 domain-containing protein [Enterobacter hormaechei subsp. xiangfangensis]|uniref:DUF1120 domain-containing protein n=3 Tax=Enterobacter TaxID=547 RepID=UPI00277CEF08|nr:DUF1120 domain-containing protein [Enterobacter hormaechei subsp. xiangfangensis]